MTGEGETGDEETLHNASGLAVRVSEEVAHAVADPLAAGLYLVATPIGNLSDITLRALTVLARADTVYCEDTRHSRTLFAHFGIRAILKPYHEHNAEEMRPRILSELDSGRRVALISDAGTPLISDPGYKLARDAATAGYTVIAVPGASAVLTALSVAALPTDAFYFAGFLPARQVARRARIADLRAVPGTLVFYEAPQRTAEALSDLAKVLGPRPGAVARELTKLHENVRRGPLDELARSAADLPPKGEVVILVGPPGDVEVSDEQIEQKLAIALQGMSLRDAAKAISDQLGVPKARVYELGLKQRAR